MRERTASWSRRPWRGSARARLPKNCGVHIVAWRSRALSGGAAATAAGSRGRSADCGVVAVCRRTASEWEGPSGRSRSLSGRRQLSLRPAPLRRGVSSGAGLGSHLPPARWNPFPRSQRGLDRRCLQVAQRVESLTTCEDGHPRSLQQRGCSGGDGGSIRCVPAQRVGALCRPCIRLRGTRYATMCRHSAL